MNKHITTSDVKESNALNHNIKGLGLIHSLLIFGVASVVLILETQLLIPFLSHRTGMEPVVFWFIVAGFGMFFPLLVCAHFMLRNEGSVIDVNTWKNRLRFRRMNRADWLWSFVAIVLTGVLSFSIIKLLEMFIGKVDSHPSFMYFEPLTPGRYWILLIWLPYWILNIMSEEILWRGVILPRQELVFGKNTWLMHGIFWGIFHIAFGWQLLLTLMPVLFILPYVVQPGKNSWTAVVIHAVINGPSFIAISLGVL